MKTSALNIFRLFLKIINLFLIFSLITPNVSFSYANEISSITPFNIHTKVDGDKLYITVSKSEDVESMTFGKMMLVYDEYNGSEFNNPEVMKSNSFSESGLSFQSSFANNSRYGKYAYILFGDDGKSDIIKNGDIFTLSFDIGENVQGDYSFQARAFTWKNANGETRLDTNEQPVVIPVSISRNNSSIKKIEAEPFLFQIKSENSKLYVTVSKSEATEKMIFGRMMVVYDEYNGMNFNNPEVDKSTNSIENELNVQSTTANNERYGRYVNILFGDDSKADIIKNGELFTITFDIGENVQGENIFLIRAFIWKTVEGQNRIDTNESPFELHFDVDNGSTVVSKILVNPEEITLKTTDLSIHLEKVIEPDDASHAVSWTSSDEEIVSVDGDGQITPKKPGTAVVTATAKDGSGVSGSCTVTVVQGVTGLRIEGSESRMMYTGASDQLQPVVTPSDAANQTVIWSSDNEAVAAVDDSGTVTGKAPGSATITGTTEDGGFTASVKYLVSGDAAEARAAKIGETEYATLAEAVAAAKARDTIVLLKDVSEGVLTLDKDCSLDLNGHTLLADGIDIPDGTGVASVSGGTLLSTGSRWTDFFRIEGSLEELFHCRIEGDIYVAQDTGKDPAVRGVMERLDSCEIDGTVIVHGLLSSMNDCNVTGSVIAQGKTGSDSTGDPGYNGMIMGIYDTTVQYSGGVYSESGAVVCAQGEIHIYSGTYDGGSGYSVTNNRGGICRIYSGKYKGVQNGDTLKNDSGIRTYGGGVALADGSVIADTPDEDGFYEVTREAQTGTVTFQLTPADAAVTLQKNGSETAEEPLVNESLPAGEVQYQVEVGAEYSYTVSKEGYQDKSGSLQLSEQQNTLTIPVELQILPSKGEVTVDAGENGSARVDRPEAEAGETVTVEVLPKDGWTVDEVTAVDEQGAAIEVKAGENGAYTFTMPEGSVKVTVTYKPSHDEICPSKAFKDLDTGKWYHEAIDYVLEQQFFNGMSETAFEPDGTMTRAMFVTVLSRMEKIDASKYGESSFTDVEDGKWYAAAVEWASQNGIVLGVGDGRFNPNGEVTREQMAAILYRYANFKKVDTSGADAAKYAAFTDKDAVSDWAVDAMTWATDREIIRGMGDNILAPQNNATRAQVAQIVMNYGQKTA